MKIILAALLATGCQTQATLSAKSDEGPFGGLWKSTDQDQSPPPVLCPPGSEYTPITLNALDSPPTASELGFKGETVALSLPDAMTQIIRLDTCDDGSRIELKQVVVNHVFQKSQDEIDEKFFVVKEGPGSKVKGLTEALRANDPTKVSIFLPYGNGRGLRLGGKSFKGRTVAYFYEGPRQGEPKTVYLGSLEVRDPFAPPDR